MSSLIQKHPALVYASDMRDICKPVSSLGGINYFAHVHIDEHDNFSAMAMNPEYIQYYLKHELYHYDINAFKINNHTEKYIIWDFLQLKGESKKLLDVSIGFGNCHSFSIIRNNEKYKDIFHFSTTHHNHSINAYYTQNIDLLNGFILCYLEKIANHKFLRSAHEQKFTMNPEYTSFALMEESNTQKHNDVIFLPNKKYYITIDRYLTMREMQCLILLNRGFTLEMVSTYLNISYRTVRAHIEKAKHCFQCDTLFELGVKFQRHFGYR